MRIAMLDYLKEDDEPHEYKGKCQDLANTYRNCLTECLILADYTQPQDFLIEALVFHSFGEYISSRDAKSSTWVLSGMIVRLAMRMGYHQESQPALSPSPFQTEIRRRLWAHIRSADIMLSFQMGLPSMIDQRALKGPLPRNFHDDHGFDEECTAIPPTVPASEATQVSYLIAKANLVFGFAHALHESTCGAEMSPERLLEIDRGLRQIYDRVPEHYKLGQLSSQQSLVLVSARFTLASIHHKSLCVLHSRFLHSASVDRLSYSRRVCLGSAMSILRFQAVQDQEIMIDGRLRSLTSYQSSLPIHDYLMAAAIITAALCSDHTREEGMHHQRTQGVPTREEMIKALALSAKIFGQMRESSLDAYKAADVLEMLAKQFEAKDRCSSSTRRATKTRACVDISKSASTPTRHRTIGHSTSHDTSSAFAGGGATCLRGVNTRHSPHHSIDIPQPIHALTADSNQLAENSSLDLLSSWAGNGVGSYDNSLTNEYSSYQTSAGWMMPDQVSQPMMDQRFDGTAAVSIDNMPYHAPLNLDDPMSTLWAFTETS
ncbi:hypothetical protein LTR17_021453 [Elasticomyces elasticus]|nr:hypothetical protein LTR17_021453 [Elasticomyces elasticus]